MQAKQVGHTATPWRVVESNGSRRFLSIQTVGGFVICRTPELTEHSTDPRTADAAFITQACNEFDNLITLLYACANELATSSETRKQSLLLLDRIKNQGVH